ncbi:MAG: hypothetical protein ABIH51_00705 [Patescibacteria group bacterium]
MDAIKIVGNEKFEIKESAYGGTSCVASSYLYVFNGEARPKIFPIKKFISLTEDQIMMVERSGVQLKVEKVEGNIVFISSPKEFQIIIENRSVPSEKFSHKEIEKVLKFKAQIILEKRVP